MKGVGGALRKLPLKKKSGALFRREGLQDPERSVHLNESQKDDAQAEDSGSSVGSASSVEEEIASRVEEVLEVIEEEDSGMRLKAYVSLEALLDTNDGLSAEYEAWGRIVDVLWHDLEHASSDIVLAALHLVAKIPWDKCVQLLLKIGAAERIKASVRREDDPRIRQACMNSISNPLICSWILASTSPWRLSEAEQAPARLQDAVLDIWKAMAERAVDDHFKVAGSAMMCLRDLLCTSDVVEICGWPLGNGEYQKALKELRERVLNHISPNVELICQRVDDLWPENPVLDLRPQVVSTGTKLLSSKLEDPLLFAQILDSEPQTAGSDSFSDSATEQGDYFMREESALPLIFLETCSRVAQFGFEMASAQAGLAVLEKLFAFQLYHGFDARKPQIVTASRLASMSLTEVVSVQRGSAGYISVPLRAIVGKWLSQLRGSKLQTVLHCEMTVSVASHIVKLCQMFEIKDAELLKLAATQLVEAAYLVKMISTETCTEAATTLCSISKLHVITRGEMALLLCRMLKDLAALAKKSLLEQVWRALYELEQPDKEFWDMLSASDPGILHETLRNTSDRRLVRYSLALSLLSSMHDWIQDKGELVVERCLHLLEMIRPCLSWTSSGSTSDVLKAFLRLSARVLQVLGSDVLILETEGLLERIKRVMQSILDTSETFLGECLHVFEAMLEFWKKISAEPDHQIVQGILNLVSLADCTDLNVKLRIYGLKYSLSSIFGCQSDSSDAGLVLDAFEMELGRRIVARPRVEIEEIYPRKENKDWICLSSRLDMLEVSLQVSPISRRKEIAFLIRISNKSCWTIQDVEVECRCGTRGPIMLRSEIAFKKFKTMLHPGQSWMMEVDAEVFIAEDAKRNKDSGFVLIEETSPTAAASRNGFEIVVPQSPCIPTPKSSKHSQTSSNSDSTDEKEKLKRRHSVGFTAAVSRLKGASFRGNRLLNHRSEENLPAFLQTNEKLKEGVEQHETASFLVDSGEEWSDEFGGKKEAIDVSERMLLVSLHLRGLKGSEHVVVLRPLKIDFPHFLVPAIGDRGSWMSLERLKSLLNRAVCVRFFQCSYDHDFDVEKVDKRFHSLSKLRDNRTHAWAGFTWSGYRVIFKLNLSPMTSGRIAAAWEVRSDSQNILTTLLENFSFT